MGQVNRGEQIVSGPPDLLSADRTCVFVFSGLKYVCCVWRDKGKQIRGNKECRVNQQ